MEAIKLENSSIIHALEKLLGKQNVLSTLEDRYCYAFDTMDQGNNVHLPDVVVLPENKYQVQEIVRLAAKNNIPIIPRGAGTNHVGGCIALNGGIIIHFSRMNKIIEVDTNNLKCTVEAGVIVKNLQKEVDKFKLFFPPDPSNLAVSTIGGGLALASSGPRHYKYGGMKEYVIDLEVITADGEIIHTGAQTAKDVCGYNLTQLFVGSEGTLGIITEATLKLIPKPEKQEIMLAFFDNLDDAASTVSSITKARLRPSTLDLIDRKTIETIEKFYNTNILKSAEACLIIEVDGSQTDIDKQIEKIKSVCNLHHSSSIVVSETQEDADKIWFARRSAFGAVAKLGPDVITEDAVVPVNKIADMIRIIQNICNKYQLTACIMGHAGDGNIHPNFSLDLRNEHEKMRFKKAKDELFEEAIKLGGTISGEHGIGMTKKKYMDNTKVKFMQMIKQSFDPKNIFNPGKTI